MSDERGHPSRGRRAEERARDDAVAPGDLPSDGIPFGRYHLLKRLSYGGMGEIFLAKHEGLGGFSKLLVIKRLLQHYRGDRDVVAMFFDEAKLQALMSDRHIVQIWDMGKVDEQYFIAMEYVEGISWRRLGERLQEREETLHPAHAVDLVVQACRGLGYAHNLTGPAGDALSLVHRDVNPQNVLVSYGGEVKLIDFGIAKSELSGHHTETGTIKGKFAYMSPEQARAEPLDRRSDIFSMGICLYELLTGKNPFHRKNVVLSLEAICDQAPTPLEELRPDAAALAPVVERAMAKNPDERFADCAELEEALVSLYLDGLCGEPREPLGELLARLFDDEIERQGAFLRRHGFASLTAQRAGASDPGTPSPLSRPGEGTRRMRRTRSESQAPSGRVSIESASPSGETQPTATLALASLPSRSAGHAKAAAAPPSEDGGATLIALEEETDVERRRRDPRPPPRSSPPPRRAALVALGGLLALVVSLGAVAALVASGEGRPPGAAPSTDVVVTSAPALVPSADEPAADEPAADEPAADEPAEEEPVVEPPVAEPLADEEPADEEAAADEPPVEELAEEEPADEPPAAEAAAEEEPSKSAAERRPSKRRPSRDARTQTRAPPVVQEKAAPTEKAAVPVGVLTVNAGGPFTLKGKGVRARNVAKLSLLAGEPRTVTISGGPVEVRLRVSASPTGADVRVESEPWTIVRANNIGRGRTPQAVRVSRGEAVQLLLKHPDAGEMKVTLGLSG